MNNDDTKIKKECVCDRQAFGQSEDVDSNVDENSQFAQQDRVELVECQAQLEVLKSKFMHANADLQNFKNRVEKERLSWMSSAKAEVLKKLLPIVDDFDRAVGQLGKVDGESGDAQQAGLVMIHKSFHKFLDSVGVIAMDNTNEFDPEKHEAIMQVESEGHESGSIVDVLEAGYLLGTQVLRPAKVSVAK